jgi:hypothetical protein
MGKQILLGTVVGAVTIFLVNFIWHMSPFAETGVHSLPHEEVLTTAMRLAISEPGWYMFPGMDPNAQRDPVAVKKWEEAFRRGPTGLIIFRPGGTEFSFPLLLLKQFCFGAFAAFVVSWLLAMSAGSLASYGQRVLFVALVALFGTIVIDLPYWSWYGFPGNYTVAHLAGIVLTWAATGFALAAVVKRAPNLPEPRGSLGSSAQ